MSLSVKPTASGEPFKNCPFVRSDSRALILPAYLMSFVNGHDEALWVLLSGVATSQEHGDAYHIHAADVALAYGRAAQINGGKTHVVQGDGLVPSLVAHGIRCIGVHHSLQQLHAQFKGLLLVFAELEVRDPVLKRSDREWLIVLLH